MEINCIYNMDCLEGMKGIPDKSIDMILCDLPYGTTTCKWDTIIPFPPLWKQYQRVIKENGAIVLFGSEPFSSKLRMSNINNYKYDWIWDKVSIVGFANAKKMPLKNMENISVFYKKLPTYNPQGLIRIPPKESKNSETHIYKHDEKGKTALNGGRFKEGYIQEFTNYPKQIITIPREKGFHPTQKPVALCEYLIKTYTNEGETVLDNCIGSGTTAIACINTNRKYIGFELDTGYFNLANERINSKKVSQIIMNKIFEAPEAHLS